ncbi:MAG: hypothetical protein IKQ71_09610 [Lachnospiraceae bacterium]|nr:hypothetical protein [Lachnospiraceae bacterium]
MIKGLSKLWVALPVVCTGVAAISPFISGDCRLCWYQEKEPDGLKEFAQKNKHGKKGKSHNEI